MKIRIITYASSTEEAKEEAENILERLTENQEPFDYYTWIETHKATTIKGKNLIGDGIAYTKKEFLEDMVKIRKTLQKYTNEFLWENPFIKSNNSNDGLWRFFMYQVGRYVGSSVWLYDHEGSGIRDPKHLKDVLEKWQCLYENEGKENPHKNSDIWVTLADVHY